MKRKHLQIDVRGYEWKVFVQSHSNYVRTNGSDSYAIVYPNERELYFDKTKLSLKLIRHEVLHVFISSTDTENNNEITPEDQEELDCTVYGNNKAAISQIEDRIIDYILKGE